MPTPLVLNATYAVTFICKLDEQVAYLRRHWTVSAIVGATGTMENLALALSAAVAPSYKGLMVNGASYRGTFVQRVSGSAPFELPVTSISGQGVGTAGATALPKQACGLISFYGASIGRRFMGRQYTPFPATADDTGSGIPTAGYVTKLDTLAATLISTVEVPGVGDTTLVPVLWHEDLGNASQIFISRQRLRWATQRKRGDYGRTNPAPL